jgi:hypothetical protein
MPPPWLVSRKYRDGAKASCRIRETLPALQIIFLIQAHIDVSGAAEQQVGYWQERFVPDGIVG